MDGERNTPAVEFGLKLTSGWIFRAVCSALILGVVLYILPTEDLAKGLATVSWSLVAGVLALFMICHAVAAAKWRFLLGNDFPYLSALRAHFAGLAANLCLPGVAGGDVVRAGLVARFVEVTRLTAGALSDRLIDMLALALLSAGGVIFLQSGTGDFVLVMQAIGLFAAAVLGAFYVLPRIVPKIVAAVPALPAKNFLLRTASEFGRLGQRPLAVAFALLLSISIQAAFVVLFISLANSAGVSAPASVWFFAWPLAKILAVLPISLGGIGLREATLAGLMVPFGVSAAPVVAASLIWQLVLIMAGLVGAVAWLTTARKGNAELRLGNRKEV